MREPLWEADSEYRRRVLIPAHGAGLTAAVGSRAAP